MDGHQFFYYLIAAFLLGNIPFIGKYVSIMNTFLHEVGHALMATILGGKVQSISLFSNTEGLAVTAHSNRLSKNLTALAGYPFSSACGFLMVWALKHGYENYVLMGFCSLLIVALILWIRNIYGLFWIISFGTITYYVLFENTLLKEPFVYFIVSVVVVQSLVSALMIMYLSIINPKNSGDATFLAGSTLVIPAFVWGLLFAVQAVYFSIQGIQLWLN
jgi:Kef-type K+ transport system membrane component KefB